MNAHDENRSLICPHCLRRFENRQGVKAHQKAKKHQTHHMVDEPWAKYAEHLAKTGHKIVEAK
jgi:hypothetical protein